MVIKIVFLGYYLGENLCLAIYGPVQVLCSVLLVQAILLFSVNLLYYNSATLRKCKKISSCG